MIDTTTVEGYHQYCDTFHSRRLETASVSANKLREVLRRARSAENTNSVDLTEHLTEYELVLTIEALDYYLRHTK